MQAADTSQSGTLEGEEFVEFYKALTKRPEVQEVFENFSADGQKLTLLEFVDFLREEQKEGERASDLALELIDRYEPSDSGKRAGGRRGTGHGAGRGTRVRKVQSQAAFCLAQGRLSLPVCQSLCYHFPLIQPLPGRESSDFLPK